MLPIDQCAALGDETRATIVSLLAERPRPVHEIASTFPISRPAISRHLRLLKEAGLVAEEKQGRENVYTLRRRELRALSVWLEQFWSLKADRLRQGAEPTANVNQLELGL